MLWKLFQQIPEIFVRLQGVGLGCFRKAVPDRACPGSADCIYDLPVLFPKAERSDRPLRGIVIDRDIPIGQEHSQILLLIDAVGDCFPGFGFRKDFLSVAFHVRKESIHDRKNPFLPLPQPLFRGKLMVLLFEMIHGVDQSQRTLGEGTGGRFTKRFHDIGKPAFGMRPASGDLQVLPLIPYGVVYLISVGNTDPMESFQEFPGVIRPPGFLVFIQDKRMRLAFAGAINPHVTFGAGRPVVFVHNTWGFIGLYHMAFGYFPPEPFIQF